MGTVVLTGGPQEGLLTNWQAPNFESDPKDRLNWVEEQIQEGEGAKEGQSAFRNLPKNLKIYNGIFSDTTKSKLVTGFMKYNIRKFVTTLSEVREIALYGSDAPQYKPIANVENKVAKCVYLESQFPRQLKKALQYATVMNEGYLWVKCEASDYGYGERMISFEDLGPLDVVATQVPKSNDIQDGYTVTAFKYMPIAEAHGRFPLFQEQLKPVSATDIKSRLQARRLDFTGSARYGEQGRTWGNLYCEIRYTYVRDLRINRTGMELPMGDPGTSWFYSVPSVGQMIPAGFENGVMQQRPARPEDCRVYPQLRLIITARGVDTPMYDGPAYDWHGKIPIVQYTVDDVPWEPGGRSLVQDVGSIEETKRKLERKIDQVTEVTLNPPIGYDRTATGGQTVENFDIFEQDTRTGMDGVPRNVLQSLLPEEVRVTQEHFSWLEYLSKTMTDQLGITDIGNLQNLKLNVNEEGMDKALESIGPIAKDIAAMVESGNAKVGYMLKFMIPQWFDTGRIIQDIGTDEITQEVYDFDPTSMVPSHMPEEFVVTVNPVTGAVDYNPPEQPSQYDKLTRAKRFAKNLRLTSVPSTLLRITAMQNQLKYLQLYRGGFPICPQTVAEKLDIDNYGEAPGTTEYDKWLWWKEQEVMVQVKGQLLAAAAMAQAGIMPPQPGGGGEGGPGGPPQPNQPHAGGRPPSGKKPPKLVEKGGSSFQPRTTIEES
jgi:hypothetical protein